MDVDCCSIELSYSRRSGRADLNRQPTVPITHNLRPAERTDKKRTGNLRALPLVQEIDGLPTVARSSNADVLRFVTSDFVL